MYLIVNGLLYRPIFVQMFRLSFEWVLLAHVGTRSFKFLCMSANWFFMGSFKNGRQLIGGKGPEMDFVDSKVLILFCNCATVDLV